MTHATGHLEDSEHAEAYGRAARLVYLTDYGYGPRRALITAHRFASRAVQEAGEQASVADVVAVAARLAGNARREHWRNVGLLGGELRPAPPTAEQAQVLERLARLPDARRLAVLRRLLGEDSASDGGDPLSGVERAVEGAFDGEPIHVDTARVCGDRPPAEVSALLLGPELDPERLSASTGQLVARRRSRRRRRLAVLGVLVLAAGAGGWWFGLRVPPLGSHADDPKVQSATQNVATGVDAWKARGELLGDADLLRRAARAWHRYPWNALAAGYGPTVLFAGRVHGITAVVMDDAKVPGAGQEMSVAVYVEGAKGAIASGSDKVSQRLVVNPAGSSPMTAGAIRLFESEDLDTDAVLLPPDAADVQTGSLDAPASGWQPARPDVRGVLEVPVPKTTMEQLQRQEWPSGGIRYSEARELYTYSRDVTLAETFGAQAPLLPVIKPLQYPVGSLSAADLCAARKQAEVRADWYEAAEWVQLSDVASGPLPGGATGYVIRRQVRGPELYQDYVATVLLAMPGGSCTNADLPSARGVEVFGAGRGLPQDADTDVNAFANIGAASVFWDAPDGRTYLVVAGTAKVARLKVSGPVPGQADGRWLVLPMPSGYYGPPAAERASVEAFDAAGHVCGQKDPAGNAYCQ